MTFPNEQSKQLYVDVLDDFSIYQTQLLIADAHNEIICLPILFRYSLSILYYTEMFTVVPRSMMRYILSSSSCSVAILRGIMGFRKITVINQFLQTSALFIVERLCCSTLP